MSTFLDYLSILVWGFLAFVLGALTIDWTGTAWWSRLSAAVTVAGVMYFALKREARDAGA